MAATVWKGYVAFGLVSFPVRLHSAARAETVHFHLLHKKDLSRVREVMYCAAEDVPVERSELVKGYEFSKGEYIVVEGEELDAIAPSSATVMEILQFAKMDAIDPIYLETSYYMAPEEAVSQPYSLLWKAMRETGYDAIAKLTMHSREHIVILRPAEKGIVLHTMYFEDELNREHETAPAGSTKFEKKEIDLARQLISTLAAPFEPGQYHDEYRANVEKLIESKRQGRAVTPIKQLKKAPVIDLMEALQKSLQKRGSKAAPVKASAAKKKVRKKSAKVA